MPITIYDVAKEAGVSKSTVSLVINNNKIVKPETQRKVHEAIDALGYVPNFSARSLTTQKTHILGVLILTEDLVRKSYNFDASAEVFPYDVFAGMPRGLVGTNYSLISERFCIPEENDALPEILKSKRVDGVLLVGAQFKEAFAEKIKKCGLPIVVIGRAHEMFDSITADTSKGAYIAAEHLVAMGHKRICYVNCPPCFSTNLPRYEGFHSAVAAYRSDILEYWSVDAEHNTGLGGYNAIKAVYESGSRPDGVITANDSIALGILRYFYEQKISVPEDVSIISFEDSVLSGYATPALSTVNINKEEMGKEACEIMIKRLDQPRMRRVKLVLPVNLVLRDSIKDRR